MDDYPRWLKKQHEISGTINSAIPITATFALSPDDLKEIEERFGGSLLTAPEIVAKRKYTGEMTLEFPIDHVKFIQSFSHSRLSSSAISKTSSAKTSKEFLAELAKVAAEVGENQEPTPEASEAKKAKEELVKVLGGAASMTAALDTMFRPRVPKTFYFAEYQQLRGRYNLLTEVVPALTTTSVDESINAAADFLKLARIAHTNVEAWDFEQSNAELEAISSMLTQLVKKNWRQNQHLQLRVDIESIPGPTVQPDRFLQFRVEDTRHDFSNRLDRRSTGFRWFVSFVASFFDFQSDNNIILLLDEPGLSLHARAQKDLLDSIDGNLTGGRQVIYTTHSPFMVRTEALNRTNRRG